MQDVLLLLLLLLLLLSLLLLLLLFFRPIYLTLFKTNIMLFLRVRCENDTTSVKGNCTEESI